MTLRASAVIALPVLAMLASGAGWTWAQRSDSIGAACGTVFLPLSVLAVAVLQFLIVHARQATASWVTVLLWIPLIAASGVLMILAAAASVWASASGVLFVFELVRRVLSGPPPEPS